MAVVLKTFQVLIAPMLGASWIQATADLLQMLGWSQVRIDVKPSYST